MAEWVRFLLDAVRSLNIMYDTSGFISRNSRMTMEQRNRPRLGRLPEQPPTSKDSYNIYEKGGSYLDDIDSLFMLSSNELNYQHDIQQFSIIKDKKSNCIIYFTVS